ncbi:Shikimate kinase,shikimate kinase,Shikimate kinase [Chlamydia serpentis]|uniref:Shikimate kinase,shikimate kinase,Shikimate kinase n=1 Tax=Chlamydia serpentis TaxID=1967782 RepID=A0A2R8FCT0_9CHLA|nr:Shikimate kinase,shikimate kinase,Shikimate kinase [Chlamydia serpentis]
MGKALAKSLQVAFYDLDDLVVSNYSKGLYSTSTEIYKAYGDLGFSHCEAEILKSISLEEGVLSLGGGTLMYEHSCQAIKNKGPLVFLSLHLTLVCQRLEKRGLPERLKEATKTKPLIEILTERTNRMQQLADYIFPVDHVDYTSENSLEQACQELLNLLKA